MKNKNSKNLNTYLPCISNGKESSSNTGDPDSISGSGRSSGEGNGSPLQYSCLEDSITEEPGGLQSLNTTAPIVHTVPYPQQMLNNYLLKSFCVIRKSSTFSFLYFKMSFFECLGVYISSSLNIAREVHLYKFQDFIDFNHICFYLSLSKLEPQLFPIQSYMRGIYHPCSLQLSISESLPD